MSSAVGRPELLVTEFSTRVENRSPGAAQQRQQGTQPGPPKQYPQACDLLFWPARGFPGIQILVCGRTTISRLAGTS